MKIVIIGTGYVGLVSGTCFAEIGHEVICVDIDPAKVESINASKSPIYEEGLDELLKRNVSNGRLRATINIEEAIVGADVTMIAVGTPFDGEVIDLAYIRQAAADIGKALKYAPDYHVVCVKSTVVPGTTEKVVGPIVEQNSNRKIGDSIGLAMNPEFLAEGTAVNDFMQPDRIVIGANDEKSATVMRKLYSPFDKADMFVTTLATSEMIKYTANSFLATVISFANEIANLCSAIDGVDVVDVMQGVHADRRLSPILPEGRVKPGLMSFLYPGTGFGGSCFPKDVKALASFGKQLGQPLQILNSVIDINRKQPEVTVGLVKEELGSLEGKNIAVLGLAFKPGTDDVRESPAMAIIHELIAQGAKITAHDPIAIDNMKEVLAEVKINYFESLVEAIDGVDAIVLVTSWPEYQNLHKLLPAKSTPIIDGRRFLDKKQFSRYRGIGLRAGEYS